MSDSLISVAQRMSTWQKMRERLNKATSGLKRLPVEYVRQVEEMRAIDDQVRDIVKRYLPSYIKSAEKSFKNRQLLDVGYFAGKFNATLKHIASLLKPLEEMSTDYIDEFYSDYAYANPDEDPFSMQHEAGNKIDAMIKEADLMDLFRSDRTRAARMVEKLFEAKVKARNRAVESLIAQMNNTYEDLIKHLDELAPLRAKGDLMNYIKTASKIAGRSTRFENSFKNIYNKHLAPLHQKVKEEIDRKKNMFNGKPSEEMVARMQGITDEPILQPASSIEVEEPIGRDVWSDLAQKEQAELAQKQYSDEEARRSGAVKSAPPPKPFLPSYLGPEPAKPEPEKLPEPAASPVEPALVEIQTGKTPKPETAKKKAPKQKPAKQKTTEEVVPEAAKTADEFFADLVKVAETGDIGLMIAMCADYSQQLEDKGDIEGSMKLLAIAEAF